MGGERSGSEGGVRVKPETNLLAGNPIMIGKGISRGDSGNHFLDGAG